jgi:predicted  nucleic acid-binding Zn-ribbon protein
MIEKIFDELADFRKEINKSFNKLSEKLDDQNEKLIKAQKDIEHMQMYFDEKIKASGKNISELKDTFKNYKSEVKSNISKEVKEKILSLKLWIMLGVISVLTSCIMIIIDKFI